MEQVIVPKLTKTGEVAELEVTTRESRRTRATINVRLALPRRRMTVLTPQGELVPLPESAEEETGIVVAQFPMGVN